VYVKLSFGEVLCISDWKSCSVILHLPSLFLW